MKERREWERGGEGEEERRRGGGARREEEGAGVLIYFILEANSPFCTIGFNSTDFSQDHANRIYAKSVAPPNVPLCYPFVRTVSLGVVS